MHLPTNLFARALLAAAPVADFSDWRPPGPDDLRSPCPALNSLANHGILPRDGRGMTLPVIKQGLAQGMNIGDDLSAFLHTAGMLASRNVLSGAFTLNDVSKHNFPIEHDASLSRQDKFFGDWVDFNQTIFKEVLAFYEGMEIATIPVTAAAKYARVQDTQKRNPQALYSAREFLLSYGEAALFLSVLGNPSTGDAPVDWVKIFFEQERLPFNEGWRPPAEQTTLNTLGSMIIQLFASSPEPLPEGLNVITAGLYGRALRGLDPVTGLLANLTCPLTSTC